MPVQQRLVGISQKDARTQPALLVALQTTVCVVLRPMPTCFVNFTRIADYGGGSGLLGEQSLEQQQQQQQQRGLVVTILQLDYSVKFVENNYLISSSPGALAPGEEKAAQLSAAVKSGEFASTFLRLLPSASAAGSSFNASSPALKQQLQMAAAIQFAQPIIGKPSYSNLIAARLTPAPTTEPTLQPTIGLGLNLSKNELAAFLTMVGYALGAVAAVGATWYLRRRRMRALAVRPEKQEKARRLASVVPLEDVLSAVELELDRNDDDDGDDYDYEEEKEDEGDADIAEFAAALAVRAAEPAVPLPVKAPPPARPARLPPQRVQLPNDWSDDDDDDDDDGDGGDYLRIERLYSSRFGPTPKGLSIRVGEAFSDDSD